MVYSEVHLVETCERAGGTVALEDIIQRFRGGCLGVLNFRGGGHDMISAGNFFIYSGNKTSATLHFTNITVQDDHEKGYYQCVGYSATVGGSDSQRFSVRVTASKLEILYEQSVKMAILGQISEPVSQ